MIKWRRICKGVSPMRVLGEWRAVDEREERVLRRCRDAIRSVLPTATVILYGSRARGDTRPDSDYDLLVLVDDQPMERITTDR